ncbi:phosphatidylinositol 3-kinase 1 [Selaginella moellendorffii]|uniref:phosphatidylinositol 3-kinase 1 n=1 Tax=Selaginella moellendorffii TaxID=88036 RepID=UPI000D1C670C|nr:phosphatidylinositol 3-kinase 1 [Selaginella moellendorffii]|eukprot:XP_024539412.1 phosphatidylinositol 3-kinase 1 [Selaginella moellendorffii]
MREDEDEGQAMFTSTLEDPELFVSYLKTFLPRFGCFFCTVGTTKVDPLEVPLFYQEQSQSLVKVSAIGPMAKVYLRYGSTKLLGPQFGDPAVRNYAVSVLENLSNEEICSFLVQLVQALHYEPRIESALLQFLVNKASVDQSLGYYLYWHIKAGLEVAFFAVKLQFAMNEFRKTCKSHVMTALSKQEKLVLSLANIARGIRQVKQKAERQKQLISLLSELESFESVALPVDPRCEVNGLELTKCKYMDSKKLPLWLVFKNTDRSVEEHTYIIFKTGDDLRQDILTLEMFSLMNKTWLRHNLDMKMTIYSCVATGDSSGMLQVVWNSETLSNICKASGGGVAVFKEDTLINWLMHETQTGENYKGALDNFTRSCAGYCVATCLLGIGDRHNDNIMLKRNGQFFHIDFGHILGHFKSKFGIKRERARFVLTPDMAFVMGGTHDPRFRSFEILCAQAFNQIRAEATKYLNLMSLMISSGLSEVSSPADVRYMHDIMLLNLSDEHAAKEFTKWIHDSLHTKSTQFNHAIHTWVHK